MCRLEEGEREHIYTTCYVEEDEKEYSVIICNSEEGEITIESASTDHEDRNCFLLENASYSMNQDYFSYNKVDLGLNFFFLSKNKE